jgi:hypothetical protein
MKERLIRGKESTLLKLTFLTAKFTHSVDVSTGGKVWHHVTFKAPDIFLRFNYILTTCNTSNMLTWIIVIAFRVLCPSQWLYSWAQFANQKLIIILRLLSSGMWHRVVWYRGTSNCFGGSFCLCLQTLLTPWRWKQLLPKLWYLCTKLHGIISLKMTIVMVPSLRTSRTNSTLHIPRHSPRLPTPLHCSEPST